MTNYTNLIRSVIIIATISISSEINAASFDCAKAKLAKEKLICSDAKLSELDSQLAQIYQKNSKELSPGARKDLLDGQRSWLSYWPKSCTKEREYETNKTPLTQCAIKKYEKRISDLKMQRKILGDLIVFRKYKIVATKQSSTDQYYPELDFLTQSYDTIDVDSAPANKKELAKSINLWLLGFQKQAVKTYRYTGKLDLSITLTDNDLPGILAASGTILSECVASCVYDKLHGYFLLAEQRPLLATDIFQGKEWEDALAQLIQKQLKIKYPNLDNFNDVNSLKKQFLYTFNVHTSVWVKRTDTSNWNLSRNKFIFEFNFGALDRYSDPDSITIPWTSLRPWLKPQFANKINFEK